MIALHRACKRCAWRGKQSLQRGEPRGWHRRRSAQVRQARACRDEAELEAVERVFSFNILASEWPLTR